MTGPPEVRDLSLAEQVSLLSGGAFWTTKALPERGIPAVLLTDGPHGIRVQARGPSTVDVASDTPATCFPPAATIGNSWDVGLAAEVGRAIGREARALGVAMVLGPGMNIKRHPLCGRNFEYLSEDPLLTGRLAAALVTGIQDTGVGACVKHFAVNNQESHRFVVDAVVDERTLREIYLAAFEEVVGTAAPRAVMAAYNQVNGLPCTSNGHLLGDVLREQWGFRGVVISDWGAVSDRVGALRAGLDLEMPSSGGLFDAELLAATATDGADRALVQVSAQRVLDMVASSPEPEPTEIPADDHHALARRAAAAGTVLLTNDGVLPIDSGLTVALIGAFAEHPRFQGSGSSAVLPTRIDTALGAFRQKGTELRYSPGYDPVDSQPDPTLIAEAVETAASADIAVVLIGLPAGYESEGTDREDLRLPGQHDDLVRAVCNAQPKTVVVLSNGAPVVMPWVDRPSAILETQLGGQAGGSALVDVLYGDAEPGGRLAETLPRSQSDVAADPWFPGQPRQVEYREGLFVGYRHHVTSGPATLFPFGHGLGYTTFNWGDPRIDRTRISADNCVTVTVAVTNTGSRPGSDVVQLYVHDRTGVVVRPRRELRAFAKVLLDPGASAEVTMTLGPRAFSFYDVDLGAWAVPDGRFDLEIARSSADVVHVVGVEITGGVHSAADSPGRPLIAASEAEFARLIGRPIPVPHPSRPFTRESTLGELSAHPIGRLFARAILRAIPFGNLDDARLLRAQETAMNQTPLRALALLSGGKLSWDAVDTLVEVVNGRYLSVGRNVVVGGMTAAGKLIAGWTGRSATVSEPPRRDT